MPFIVAAAVVLPGCGEDPPPPRAAQVEIAAVGDSITAGQGVADGEAYLAQAGRRLKVAVRACGVSGERTDEIAARLEGCAAGARVLIVQGGVNDIAQGVPVATIAENLRAMVQAGRRDGRRVLVAEILPWNNGHPRATAPIEELNRRIRALAREERAEVLPFHAALEDPAARGRMKPEWTVDGDHPSAEGHRRMAVLIRLQG